MNAHRPTLQNPQLASQAHPPDRIYGGDGGGRQSASLDTEESIVEISQYGDTLKLVALALAHERIKFRDLRRLTTCLSLLHQALRELERGTESDDPRQLVFGFTPQRAS